MILLRHVNAADLQVKGEPHRVRVSTAAAAGRLCAGDDDRNEVAVLKETYTLSRCCGLGQETVGSEHLPGA